MNYSDFIDFIGKDFKFDTIGITEKTTFSEINFDELDMIDLVMSVEDNFRVEVPDEALKNIKTIGDFCDYINSKYG